MKVKHLYIAVLLAMPLSYATKLILGMDYIAWINPALILSLILFLLIRPTRNLRLPLLAVLGATFLSTLICFLAPPAAASLGTSLYNAYREPLRLFLNLGFFLVSCHFLAENRGFTLNWLSISVCVQFIIALAFWLR